MFLISVCSLLNTIKKVICSVAGQVKIAIKLDQPTGLLLSSPPYTQVHACFCVNRC
jgi:hypothetical protein